MGAIKIGLGPLAVTRQAPAWMSPFQLALDFRAGRYQLNRQQVGLSRIDSLYHTRASARYAEFSDGRAQECANGVMAVTDRGYDSREGWTVLNSNSLALGSWTASGATSTAATGDYLGFTSGRAIASAGAVTDVVTNAITGGLTSAAAYTVRARYSEGTSSRLRIAVNNVTAGTSSVLSGSVGALASTSTGAGSWSNIVNRVIGPGLFEVSAAITAGATGASATIAVGPDSATSGQDVVVIAAQITQTAYPMPWGSGTVAPDALVIPAADAGLAINPSLTGLTMVWRGRDFQSAAGFPRILEVLQDINNRASILRATATGALSAEARTGGVGNGNSVSQSVAPYGADITVAQVWRPDGSIWRKIGANAAAVSSRPAMPSVAYVSVGVEAHVGGAGRHNAQHRIAAVGAFALSDADALALFNQAATA